MPAVLLGSPNSASAVGVLSCHRQLKTSRVSLSRLRMVNVDRPGARHTGATAGHPPMHALPLSSQDAAHGGVPPAHTPAAQASAPLQNSPSEQDVPSTAGTQAATLNYNAYPSIIAALAAYPSFAGPMIVNGGTYASALLAGGGASILGGASPRQSPASAAA